MSGCTREKLKVMEQKNNTMKSVLLGRSVCHHGGDTFGGRGSKIFLQKLERPVPDKFGWKRSVRGRSISEEELIFDT